MIPEEQPARSNHIPIVTVLHAPPEIQPDEARPNYWAADWETVREELTLELKELDIHEKMATIDGFTLHLGKLTQIMLEVIDTKVLKTKPSPYQKCWWSKELTEKPKEVCRLMCKAYSRRFHPYDPIHYENKSMIKAHSTIVSSCATALLTSWESVWRGLDVGFSLYSVPTYYRGPSILCGPRFKVQGLGKFMVCWSLVFRV